jgi:hypothetical protein
VLVTTSVSVAQEQGPFLLDCKAEDDCVQCGAIIRLDLMGTGNGAAWGSINGNHSGTPVFRVRPTNRPGESWGKLLECVTAAVEVCAGCE